MSKAERSRGLVGPGSAIRGSVIGGLLLLAGLLAGCGTVREIQYPESMTHVEAREIIADYTARYSALKLREARGATTNSSFQSLRVVGPHGPGSDGRLGAKDRRPGHRRKWRIEQCDYSEIEDHAIYHTSANWFSFATALIVGPTTLRAAEVDTPSDEIASFPFESGPTSYACLRLRNRSVLRTSSPSGSWGCRSGRRRRRSGTWRRCSSCGTGPQSAKGVSSRP